MIGNLMNVSLSIANQGMKSALIEQSQSAQRIANLSPESDTNLALEMVKQMESKHLAAANTAVAKTADSMMGNIIDLVG